MGRELHAGGGKIHRLCGRPLRTPGTAKRAPCRGLIAIGGRHYLQDRMPVTGKPEKLLDLKGTDLLGLPVKVSLLVHKAS